MEYINNLGAIGKFAHKSNVSSIRYIEYYFDEHLLNTNLYSNTHLMVNAKETIPPNTTCLMINVKISFDNLYRIVCDTAIHSVVFMKDMLVDNIDATSSAVCRNIKSVVCYNTVAVGTLIKFFPNLHSLYLYRQRETDKSRPVYTFAHLENLVVYSSGSAFDFVAPNLQKLSIYISLNNWLIDLNKYPQLHTVRVDEKIKLLNLQARKHLKILQFYPSSQRTIMSAAAAAAATTHLDEVLDLTDMKVDDLILPPIKKYLFKKRNVIMAPGVYVRDEDFLFNTMTRDVVSLQVYDNVYPLKMCSLRFNNLFYKYFPFPGDVTSELIERFNIQKQRENLIMIFNFDLLGSLQGCSDWSTWYNACTELYHRLPIIIQNGQLMLTDGSNEAREKQWPNMVTKIRRECVIFLPEEELLYINCSPMRLQTLVDKVNNYRRNKFTITKLWLVTNGFELQTKDIEERVDNLLIVHNEIKMYIAY